MNTIKLSFPEVINRINAGVCSRYKFRDHVWWVVIPETLMVRRKSVRGITLNEYIRMHRESGILKRNEYSAEL